MRFKKIKKFLCSTVVLSMMAVGAIGSVSADCTDRGIYPDQKISGYGSIKTFPDYGTGRFPVEKENDSYIYFRLANTANSDSRNTTYVNSVNVSTYAYLDNSWTCTDYMYSGFERPKTVYVGNEYLITNYAYEKNDYSKVCVGLKVYNNVSHEISILAKWSPDSIKESGHTYYVK